MGEAVEVGPERELEVLVVSISHQLSHGPARPRAGVRHAPALTRVVYRRPDGNIGWVDLKQ